MTTIYDLLAMELDIRGYAAGTKEHYLSHLTRLLKFSCVPPDQLDESHAKLYLQQIVLANQSFSTLHIAYSAIKFVFVNCLNRTWNLQSFPRPKNEVKLPKFLSTQEVAALLVATSNLKHRAILSTVYSAGLRVSEVTNLKLSDIRSDSMQIFVSQGKGRKDRYTLLSEQNLILLRKHFIAYKPSNYLFSNDHTGEPLCERTVQVVFKTSLKAANINRDLSVHALRHSFACHLIDNNVDIYFISQLLGHANLETTAIYLHVAHKAFSKIVSPLDTFFQEPLL